MQLFCLSVVGVEFLRSPNSIEDYITLGFILLLLLLLCYDFLYLKFLPKIFIKRKMAEIGTLSRDPLSKALIYSLTHLNPKQFSEDVQKLPYFSGMQRQFSKIFQTPEFQKKYLTAVLPSYQQILSKMIFAELWPPRHRIDLELADHKCRHQQREIAFAVVAIQKIIDVQIPQDMTPLVKDLLNQHHLQIQNLRAAIQKDQDALPILGMAVPLEQAAELIANSGEDFDVTGIQVKSLCSIAGYALPSDWDLFCRLVLKASQGSTNNFIRSFDYNPDKGETIPLKFLSALKKWIQQNKVLDTQGQHFNYICEKMQQFGEPLPSSTLANIPSTEEPHDSTHIRTKPTNIAETAIHSRSENLESVTPPATKTVGNTAPTSRPLGHTAPAPLSKPSGNTAPAEHHPRLQPLGVATIGSRPSTQRNVEGKKHA